MSPKLSSLMHLGALSALPWTPSSADGTALLWLDATDNDSMTLDGSSVTEWRSKVGTWTYSQATGALQPSLSTVNGVQSVHADYSQFLSKEEDAVVVDNSDKFLFGAVIDADNATILQGIWCDGSTSKEVIMLDVGNDANWGRASWASPFGRFSTVRFDSGNTMSVAPEMILLTYDGVNNNSTGWTSQFNSAVTDVVAGTPHANFGGFGRLFDNALTYYYAGHICEIVCIRDYTTRDKSKLASYLLGKWSI